MNPGRASFIDTLDSAAAAINDCEACDALNAERIVDRLESTDAIHTETDATLSTDLTETSDTDFTEIADASEFRDL